MKYILFFFNIVFFICGAAILGVGIWAKVDDSFSVYNEIISFNSSNTYFDSTVWLMIGVGAFIFLVGFLGCCGACQEKSWMLNFYAFLVGIVFCAQIAAA